MTSLLHSAATTLSRLNAAVEKRIMSLAELDAAMDRQFFGLPTSSGQFVNVETALQAGAVWACVQAISESIASLPCILYRDLPGGGKEKNTTHRLYDLLKNSPNPEMTGFEFWSLVIRHRLLWGNFYGQIIRDDYGAREVWPLEPSKMKVLRDPDTQKLVYSYKKDFSKPPINFAFAEILHVKGPTLDGVTGLSAIAYQRQTIGLALAAEDYGARWFGNGANPGGVIGLKGKISPEGIKRLKADWEQKHAGTSNAHRVAVLEEGTTFTPTTIPPEDSQFLQTRRATKEDIAAIFRVPPHKIGLLEHTNRASIEEQNIEWVIDSLRPEVVRIQQAIQRDLIAIGDGKRNVYAQFDLMPLLQGNGASRAAIYAIGRQWGYYSADDVREFEGLNPIPNGEGQVYLVPMNMISSGQALDNTTPTPDSGPAITPKVDDNPPADVSGDTTSGTTKSRDLLRELVPLLAATTSTNGRH